MLWFLNWLPHSREPEDGLCSLSILLSSDLGHKANTILQRKQAPHLRSPGSWKEAVKAHLGCVVVGQRPEDAMVVVHTDPFNRLSERMRVL